MKKRVELLFMKNKKGSEDLLLYHIIKIIIVVMFLVLISLFVSRTGQGAISLEQSYAKNIALLIDASRPVTDLKINMDDAMALAEQNGVDRKEVVTIKGNIVTVKLSKKGGYEYTFFNDYDVTAYPDIGDKNYIIKINGYLENEAIEE